VIRWDSTRTLPTWLPIHRVKWRNLIYDLCVVGQHVILCQVKWWRFVMLFDKILCPSYHYLLRKWCHCDKHFSELTPHCGGKNSWYRYFMKKLRHCPSMYAVVRNSCYCFYRHWNIDMNAKLKSVLTFSSIFRHCLTREVCFLLSVNFFTVYILYLLAQVLSNVEILSCHNTQTDSLFSRTTSVKKIKLEHGPMPNVMVALLSVQRRKVWLMLTTWLPCSNAAKTRNPLKLAGVPQTPEPISAVSGPKFTILWGYLQDILLLNKFFCDCRYVP